jgi:transcription elongation factor Elf1
MIKSKISEIPTKKTFTCFDCGHKYTIKLAKKAKTTIPKCCKNCSR